MMKRLLSLFLLFSVFCANAAPIVIGGPRVPSGVSSAVSLDAKMAAGNSSDGLNQNCAGTSCASTGITVGASAKILVVPLCFQSSPGDGPVTSLACTWNGSAMTEAASNTNTLIFNSGTSIWYILNPAAGANSLSCTWTGSSDMYMSAASFNNATGISGGHTVIPDSQTVTVTSDANGATVAAYCSNGSAPTVNFTKIYSIDPNIPGGGASYQLGGTSNVHTFTGGGGTTPLGAGIHIVN